MSIERIVVYEVRCDVCDGRADGPYMSRQGALDDVKAGGALYGEGWRRRGRTLCCPACCGQVRRVRATARSARR